jgi:serine/threonine protein kinase
MTGPIGEPPPRTIGRYALGGLVATGGMAEVHLGQVRGPIGFARTVAIKRMQPHFANDPDFATMFADEARLAARIRHPNVVATLDVVLQGANLCIVMEYIEGVTVAQLMKLAMERRERMPPAVAVAIVRDTLEGLHSAHEAVDAEGQPLGIVHRDVSPQNVIVGVDGVARVLDFGIAKANVRLHQTREGSGLKGKLAYMAPEQLEGAPVVRQSDVFAASIVLWEALTGERAYAGASEAEVVGKLLRGPPPPPSSVRSELGDGYDAVLARGLARAPDERFASAREMAMALTSASAAASAAEVGEWVARIAAVPLAERSSRVRALETALHESGDASSETTSPADPEGTMPATPAGVAEPLPPSSSRTTAAAETTARDASNDSSSLSLASRSSRPSRSARSSRARIAALVAVACGITAVAVLAWADRRAPRRSDAIATTSAAPASAPAPVALPLASAASPTAAPTQADPAPAMTAPTPTSAAKARKMPPRGPSRAASPAIPDHL